MKKIKQVIIGITLFLGLAGSMGTPTVSAANLPEPGGGGSGCTTGHVLTFPVWYRNLAQNPRTCTVQITKLNDVWTIALNLLEILLQVSGYVAAGFITWGGFKYMKAQGNPQSIASAKSTILDASIGLGIALTSVAIVNYVSGLF